MKKSNVICNLLVDTGFIFIKLATVKKKKQPKEKERKKNAEKMEQSLAEEKRFDFGGIPSRDLKKNLGCG